MMLHTGFVPVNLVFRRSGYPFATVKRTIPYFQVLCLHTTWVEFTQTLTSTVRLHRGGRNLPYPVWYVLDFILFYFESSALRHSSQLRGTIVLLFCVTSLHGIITRTQHVWLILQG